jgi:hypothetical protein
MSRTIVVLNDTWLPIEDAVSVTVTEEEFDKLQNSDSAPRKLIKNFEKRTHGLSIQDRAHVVWQIDVEVPHCEDTMKMAMAAAESAAEALESENPQMWSFEVTINGERYGVDLNDRDVTELG